jgi:LysM repeat protein
VIKIATPMTASQIKAQLKKWGVPFKEYKNWATHNRNHVGKWGPVNGFMVHHTGSDSTDQRALLYNGISGLPGPLCHFGLAQDGTVHLVGWGRANHAGAGDPDVLNAVINENYGANPPVDNQSSVDGNARFYGVEIWYSGSHKMTDKQYATLRKLAAAILDFHKWTEKSVIGHGEWGSPGKWDPGISSGKMMNMATVRSDIKATLSGKATAPAKPATPAPAKPSTATSHTVVKGDTLYSIGKKYGVTVANLKKWNNLKSDELSIGKKLTLKAPATTPTQPTVQQQIADILKRLAAVEAKLK